MKIAAAICTTVAATSGVLAGVLPLLYNFSDSVKPATLALVGIATASGTVTLLLWWAVCIEPPP